ncbi:MAG: ABC transporter ATP-binding protein [Clostridia bacterium]|nr:ABC transporter ATP-binding protein [Clostridia bacterium]
MRLQVVKGSFSYSKDKKILEDLNLTLDKGKFLCILGQNGIGKTTFLNCLTGILKWDSGYVSLNGKRVDGISKEKEVAYVPQARGVDFPFTALDMVAMGRTKHMGFFATPTRRDRLISLECLEMMGILDLADRKCSQMSGGQLQMVYIARALASNPRLIILDEPEAHLDFKNQALILNRLKDLVEEKGISCIMNTHHPQHALKISDYTLILGENGMYHYGETMDTLTEENINQYFRVATRIVDLKNLGIDEKAFVMLSKNE